MQLAEAEATARQRWIALRTVILSNTEKPPFSHSPVVNHATSATSVDRTLLGENPRANAINGDLSLGSTATISGGQHEIESDTHESTADGI